MTLRRVSIPTAQKQSTSFNERHSLTELKKQKGEGGSQFARYMISPNLTIPVMRGPKWVIMARQNPELGS